FRAKLDNVRSLATILRAIAFKDKANCTISQRGIHLTVEDARSLQARTQLRHIHFREFDFPSPPANSPENNIHFNIDVQTLIDCAAIFGGTKGKKRGGTGDGHGTQNQFVQLHDGIAGGKTVVPVRISCPMNGGHLSLMLEERGVITECRLTTFDSEDYIDMFSAFNQPKVLSKIIMKSYWLRDALAEFDATAENITLTTSPTHPYLRLSTSSLTGESQLDYPKDSDVLESFQCATASRWNYQHALLQMCQKALSLSSRTCLRINAEGFLNMQFMININEKDIEFAEYIIA
ncbi:Rad1/Rec1/Rad17, partial [Phlyctochytrium arcticum]